jgi:hypothetical protein
MRVRVSYEALPGPGDYEFVRSDVERQLPLRNLHWVRTSGANRSIRTIQSLPVDFRPLHSFGSNQGALSLLERPYLHLLFVVCDVRLFCLSVHAARYQTNVYNSTGQRDVSRDHSHPDQRVARLRHREADSGVAHRPCHQRAKCWLQVLPTQRCCRRQD